MMNIKSIRKALDYIPILIEAKVIKINFFFYKKHLIIVS